CVTTQVAPAPPPAKPKKPAQVTTPFTTQVAAATPPVVAAQPSKPKVTSAPSGKYRLQVAAVRSRSEADAVAASLMQKYGSKLGQRRPVVDEAVIGSMGTFYRVRVGPYANAKEPQQLCGTLRTSGFDCLVVTQ
ncbi:MAG: SPOR domain-containing protein, partial [Hyphomicrobium sp.]